MNSLSRDQQIQIIACLTEGQSIRATERITGIDRDTIMRFGQYRLGAIGGYWPGASTTPWLLSLFKLRCPKLNPRVSQFACGAIGQM